LGIVIAGIVVYVFVYLWE